MNRVVTYWRVQSSAKKQLALKIESVTGKGLQHLRSVNGEFLTLSP
ncbi:hypothetical protein [Okeania sp. SIO2C2]|nr:hypothetical protein [Okeania sp. SIO2C2]